MTVWVLKQPIKKVLNNDQSVDASHNPRIQFDKQFISQRSEQTMCVCIISVSLFLLNIEHQCSFHLQSEDIFATWGHFDFVPTTSNDRLTG